jgi:hypothetical protein
MKAFCRAEVPSRVSPTIGGLGGAYLNKEDVESGSGSCG